jgi:predicted transcriptional regulator
MTKELLLLQSLQRALTALDETNGSPESMLYIFCEMNMNDYQMIRDILVKAGFVTIKGNYVTLTSKGKKIAQKLNKHLANKQ